MKNIYILPTDKPSRLAIQLDCKPKYNLQLGVRADMWTKNWEKQNIYITSDEEIKEGDWYLCLDNTKCNDSIYKCNEVWLNMEEKQPSYCKKIILTDNKDLIKEGVQSIDDEFLEWFIKNPSCEEVEIVKTAPIRPFGSLYKIIIPKEEAKKKHIVMLIGDKVNEEQTKCYCGHTTYCDCGPEEPKQETVEETIERLYPTDYGVKSKDIINIIKQEAFINGAKWQQEQILDFLYSEITERRDYSASKMCEKVIEFIENLKNK